MKDDFDPMGSRRDAFDFASGVSKMLHGIEATKQSQLLEEQIRLQKEALELEKKRQAQEQEKLRQGQQGRGQMEQQVSKRMVPCLGCNGKGRSSIQCSACRGKGCSRCNGTGKIACHVCNGTGTVEQNWR